LLAIFITFLVTFIALPGTFIFITKRQKITFLQRRYAPKPLKIATFHSKNAKRTHSDKETTPKRCVSTLISGICAVIKPPQTTNNGGKAKQWEEKRVKRSTTKTHQ
jgi:hypothetical protein